MRIDWQETPSIPSSDVFSRGETSRLGRSPGSSREGFSSYVTRSLGDVDAQLPPPLHKRTSRFRHVPQVLTTIAQDSVPESVYGHRPRLPHAAAPTHAEHQSSVSTHNANDATPAGGTRNTARGTPGVSTGNRAVENSVPGENGSHLIDTPFGVFDRDPQKNRKVVDAGRGSGWQMYFKTAQPGQWMADSTARAKFVEVYGQKALTTLDYTGTVPEHVNPLWVTSVPVDSTGRPIFDPNRVSRLLGRIT